MNKCSQLLPFLQGLFDDPATARKAGMVVAETIKTHSPRLSEIARWARPCVRSSSRKAAERINFTLARLSS